MAKPKKPRAKRFERDDTQLQPMRLTRRDRTIIDHVAEHRFLSSKQIAALVGESPRIVRRLQKMFAAGYLDRPKSQLQYYGEAGSEPLVYALGRLGAKLVATSDHAAHEAHRWTHKNKHVGQTHVLHTIETADVLIRYATATRATNDVTLISEQQLLNEAPAATRTLAQPHKLTVDVEWKGRRYRLSTIPDGVMAFEFATSTAPERSNFVIERDRETMPVMRKGQSLDRHNRQTSMLSKFLTYYQAWRDGLHSDRYGWENFRVLTITTSDDRVASMVKAVKAITDNRGSNLFLFTTYAALTAAGDNILKVRWTSGKGEPVALTD